MVKPQSLSVPMEPASGADALDASQWLSEHGNALLAYASARLTDREVAEDLVQETFVAAWAARNSFKGDSQARTWLIGILRHKLSDHFRRQAREPITSPLPEDPAFDGQFDARGHWRAAPKAWAPDAGTLLENHEFWEVFHQCMANLPEIQGRAFAVRELNQTPATEACQVLQVTPTNLWQLLSRARSRLRRCLEVKWFCNKE